MSNKRAAEINSVESTVLNELDQAENCLTELQLAKLRKARLNAIQHIAPESSFTKAWATGIAVAAVITMIAVVPIIQNENSLKLDNVVLLEHDVDMDLLVSHDNLDMYEDLDFFEWLDERASQG